MSDQDFHTETKTTSGERLSCRRCGSHHVRRSARRGVERWISAVGVFPFRCEACDARFLARWRR